jgi:hypothetical protein
VVIPSANVDNGLIDNGLSGPVPAVGATGLNRIVFDYAGGMIAHLECLSMR